MFRKMYQGGSSRKQGPRLAIRDPDDEPPRDDQVWPCEWPSEEFMVHSGIKDEFDAYVRNADLEDFVPVKILAELREDRLSGKKCTFGHSVLFLFVLW